MNINKRDTKRYLTAIIKEPFLRASENFKDEIVRLCEEGLKALGKTGVSQWQYERMHKYAKESYDAYVGSCLESDVDEMELKINLEILLNGLKGVINSAKTQEPKKRAPLPPGTTPYDWWYTLQDGTRLWNDDGTPRIKGGKLTALEEMTAGLSQTVVKHIMTGCMRACEEAERLGREPDPAFKQGLKLAREFFAPVDWRKTIPAKYHEKVRHLAERGRVQEAMAKAKRLADKDEIRRLSDAE